jgi:SAM-dependent methyltransferase
VTQASHPFVNLADHMGRAYLRYSFTKGTLQEVDFMFSSGVVGSECSVLDVGCGPGRHAIELASRGCRVRGIDVSERFIAIAREDAGSLSATFDVMNAVDLNFEEEFDAAICICQGGFGMHTDDANDRAVLRGIARSLKPGGALLLTAFNAYFSIRHHVDARFDATAGVSTEVTSVLSESGEAMETELVTGCYTPRELRLLAESVGLQVIGVYGGEPGAYGLQPPSVDLPENLLLARKTS